MVCLGKSIEEKYWEERYATGGSSGIGSVGIEKKWKWKVITNFIPKVDHVIDVGCGDLSFWTGKNCEDYIGIDISETIIERNKIKRPKWVFICAPAEKYIKSLRKECVFCLDVFFHIMNPEKISTIIENLCVYSNKYIFIHTWITNPFSRRKQLNRLLKCLRKLDIRSTIIALKIAIFHPYKDGGHQYFHPFEKYIHIFEEKNFKLLDKRENPNGVSGLYIFKRQPK
ncbi:methyltransferase domain-containing protein [[Eubacterium] cellulosolvens]